MISLVSINIELDNHYPQVIKFLQERKPDIVLMQEVYKKDLKYLENALGMSGVYTGSAIWGENKHNDEFGIMTLSRLPINNSSFMYYSGDCFNLQVLCSPAPSEVAKTARALLIVEVNTDDQDYCFVNTHFTWSPDGQPTAQQRIDCEKMMALLSTLPQVVLCGDFNAPRGTEIFDIIATKYKDNIPVEIESTIDKNLHRKKDLKIVVDGLFTSSEYKAKDVEVIDGISDHCAIFATIYTRTR